MTSPYPKVRGLLLSLDFSIWSDNTLLVATTFKHKHQLVNTTFTSKHFSLTAFGLLSFVAQPHGVEYSCGRRSPPALS